MICPFCGEEMEKGILSGDGRSSISWKPGDKKASFAEKFLGDAGSVTAVKYTLASFTIESYFCSVCQKMIFDTDIKR